MIKPAILYKDQLTQLIAETWYNPEYMYYYDTTPGIPDIADKPDNQYQFVSVDKNGEVLGYFSYWVYEPSRRAMNFGLMSFKKGSTTFISDVIQMFKDMFEKYGIHSAEWRCYEDNTEAVGVYDWLIERYGGRRVGILRDNAAPMNRTLCNTVLYEVCYQDLYTHLGKVYSKKEWFKIREKGWEI